MSGDGPLLAAAAHYKANDRRAQNPTSASRKGTTMDQPHEIRDTNCFKRAQSRGQETFTIVEQDATGPGTILDWIDRNFATAPDAKLRDAFETALRWRSSKCNKKMPD